MAATYRCWTLSPSRRSSAPRERRPAPQSSISPSSFWRWPDDMAMPTMWKHLCIWVIRPELVQLDKAHDDPPTYLMELGSGNLPLRLVCDFQSCARNHVTEVGQANE